MQTLFPGCKINLGLRITGLTQNGYHELDTFFVPLAKPCDTLTLSLSSSTGFKLSCSSASIDLKHNTLSKAYALFQKARPQIGGVEAHLIKGINSGAGLGGGSSDAASLLLWLNNQVTNPLNAIELAELALQVGADVPFFLHNKPVRAIGLGEKFIAGNLIDDLNLHGAGLLLLCPQLCVSTAEIFKIYDQQKKDLTMYNPAGISQSSSWVINNLEEIVFSLIPSLRQLKAQLLRFGARAAVMSGSGSSLVGIFHNLAQAKTALTEFPPGLNAYAFTL